MKILRKILLQCEEEIRESYPFIEVFDLLAQNEIVNSTLLPRNGSVYSESVTEGRQRN